MGTIDPAPPLGFSSSLNIRNLYVGSILRSASDAPSYISLEMWQWEQLEGSHVVWNFLVSLKYFFYSYLSCNSIENSNDTGQTTAKSNANQACQNNTEDGKEDIKCQKDNSQPVEIQKQIFSFIISTNFSKIIIQSIKQTKVSKCPFWSSTYILSITSVLHLFEASKWSFNSNWWNQLCFHKDWLGVTSRPY